MTKATEIVSTPEFKLNNYFTVATYKRSFSSDETIGKDRLKDLLSTESEGSSINK